MKITFVGGGNMAAALIGGLVGKGFASGAIAVVEPAAEARDRLVETFGVTGYAPGANAYQLGDVVVLAVKPQQIRDVAQELVSRLAGRLVLSIAAGIRLADLSRWLGGHQHIARCMPNTPALIGQGVSGVYAHDSVSPMQRSQVTSILEAVGAVVWVNEEAALDAVTAISGSGPAYVFYFIEALEKAALELELSPTAARQLVLQTFTGAVALAANSDEPVSVLRERVTSKGGTTERAVATLADEHVAAAIQRAARAACARAKELGDELGRD